MCTKVDSLWKLHAAAWASFQRRAGNEFRFALSVWTAAVILIGIALKGDVRDVPAWLAIPALAAFVALHWWYERGMARSNNADLAKCYELEKVIMTEIGQTWSAPLQERIAAFRAQDPEGQPQRTRFTRWCGWASKN